MRCSWTHIRTSCQLVPRSTKMIRIKIGASPSGWPSFGTITYWKRVVVGVCELWSVEEPSQNQKRKVRPATTEWRKRCAILENDDLDTGEELLINALPKLTDKNPNQQTPRHLTYTSARYPSDLRTPGSCVGLCAIAAGMNCECACS